MVLKIISLLQNKRNSIFHICNSLGLTHLTRMRVGLSHLHEHRFWHNFRDSLNPICNRSNAIESTKHYLLHCSNFKNERQSLLQNVRIVNPNLLPMNEDALTHLQLYGGNILKDNTFLLNSVIKTYHQQNFLTIL